MIPGEISSITVSWTKIHGIESKETYSGQLSNGYVGFFVNSFTAYNMFNVLVQSKLYSLLRKQSEILYDP